MDSNKDRREIDPETLEKLRTIILDLFAASLYHDVGIRSICLQAKVSPKTIYKYFGNKEEILYGCIKQDIDRLNELFITAINAQDSISGKIKAVVNTWCDFYFQHQSIARIVFLNIPQGYWVADHEFNQTELHNVLYAVITEGQRQGTIWQGVEADAMNEVLMGAAHRMMVRWLTTEKSSEEDIKRILIDCGLKLVSPLLTD